jgi:hypothetical protein
MRCRLRLLAIFLALGLLAPGAAHAQTPVPAPFPAKINPSIVEAIGVQGQLDKLFTLEQKGEGETNAALLLRNRIMQRIMLASFDVDETLARIDAEAAHVSDSRSVLDAQKQHREAALNIATFAVSGALGTAGSAMQLTSGLNHAGNALNVAAGASALSLSIVQLKMHGDKRVLLSPYNMLAEVLGQTPNAQSRYPDVVKAYLQSPTAGDGELPDNAPPQESLRNAWYRLHRLQGNGSDKGASLASATTDPAGGQKLSSSELTDREAMLRDLHGAVALLKTDLRNILMALN